MDADRWGRIQSAFEGALELHGEDRERFLERTCGEDAAVHEEVVALLRSAETAADYFTDLANQIGTPTGEDGAAEPQTDPRLGRRVGNYRLTELIGRGGMGAVYLAERDDDQFAMRAAVKLLPLGMDTVEARQRFLFERQVLAGLEHPGIAHLIDGGVTADGTPYFVMEHVEGSRIDTYCDSHRLDIGQRLDLFLRVCEAVQFAHGNLIVHRDLKPSNILVTEAGDVKLLDFGIARVLDRDGSSGRTMLTGLAHPMTLAFASPEQVRGEAITTASDVYALGALLYMLLSGHHPYALTGLSAAEVERAICEEVPEPPSTTMVQPRLRRELRGDLDAITMTALRKEPARRYPSVAQLADDLRRYESGLPVSAHKDTVRYRVTRFVARHKGGVAAATALVLLITALAVVSTRFAITAGAQSRVIAQESATADEVSTFLIDLFQVSDPRQGAGDTVRARAILDRGAESIEEGLAAQPALQARMMSVLGQVYNNLGLFDDSRRLHAGALAVRHGLYGSDHLDVATSAEAVARAMRSQRFFRGAEPLLQEALEIRRRLGDEPLELANTLEVLALVLRDLDQPDSAAVLMDEALATKVSVLGENHFQTVNSLERLAYIVRAQGHVDSAEVLYRRVIPQLRLHGDSGAVLVGPTLNNLAYLLRTQERYSEAESYYREALTMEQEWGVPPNQAMVMLNLAAVLNEQGESRKAEAVMRDRILVNEQHWPPGHWQIGSAHEALGVLQVRMGDTIEAGGSFRRAAEIYAEALGPEHGWTAHAKAFLGTSLMAERRFAEAEEVLLEALKTLRVIQPGGEWTEDTVARMVLLYRAWGRTDEAERYQAMLSGDI